jgi:5-formyltetrahydrofolate cyclo-ligase
MLTLRNSTPVAELDALSSRIFSKLVEVPEIQGARTVSTYLHTGSEVRTGKIVDWLLSKDKRVVVPLSDKLNKRLLFSELRDPEKELAQGTYGILEPKLEFRRPVPLEQVDVILVPGVAWDRRGYRIGYGAGYYDRSINSLVTSVFKIGLAYEFQLVVRIPTSRYDRRVDEIVTELRVIDTGLKEPGI